MRTLEEIEPLKKPVLKILELSHYPKHMTFIISILWRKGLIGEAEKRHFSVLISYWLNRNTDIISRKEGKSNAYMLKENARKYWHAFLEDEQEDINNKSEPRHRQFNRAISKARGEEQ